MSALPPVVLCEGDRKKLAVRVSAALGFTVTRYRLETTWKEGTDYPRPPFMDRMAARVRARRLAAASTPAESVLAGDPLPAEMLRTLRTVAGQVAYVYARLRLPDPA